MKRLNLSVISIFLAALVILLPVCFADEIKMTEGVILNNSSCLTNISKNANFAPIQSASAVDAFQGLAAAIVILISPYVTAIAIGAAVIAAGYMVYHYGTTAWIYYTAYSYSSVDFHAYDKHNTEFKNIWGDKIPPRSDFDNKCKDNINSKSSTTQRFIDRNDGSSVAYNPSTGMVTIGNPDGKIISTCYKDGDGSTVRSKTLGENPKWIRIN